ncbi:MAG: helix-turn-helix transcriptional regulator [Bacteroidia bacterium]|nr:helix-turn-helix transcriptional regulator [Bacteroidia bacterium]
MEKSEFNKKIGQYLKKKRLQKKLTQAELASIIGNDFQNISRIERGVLSPTLYWLSKVTDALEMNLGDFIKNALK